MREKEQVSPLVPRLAGGTDVGGANSEAPNRLHHQR